MRDIHHNILVEQALDPAVATGTVRSATIDLQGFEGCEVQFSVGESGDTLSGSVYWTLTLEDSPDDSTYTLVGASGLLGALTVIDAAAEDDVVQPIGYIGGERYVQAVVTATGTHTNGTPIGILAIKGHPKVRPATA